MRIALAQINSTLGAFKENREKILNFVQRAYEKKAELVIFPEATLFGYHPFDLLERSNLVKQQKKELSLLLKQLPSGIHVIVGGFEFNKAKNGRPYFNAAYLLKKNKVLKVFKKELLPTGDVFDEARFIEKGSLKENYFNIGKRRFFLTICEDIWAWEQPGIRSQYVNNPIKEVKKKPIDLVINISASPFHLEKLKHRYFMTSQTAKFFKAPIAYVNMIGAQDEIIYDGQSFVMDPNGKILAKCLDFVEDLNIFDIEEKTDWNGSAKTKTPNSEELLRKALVLGIRDFSEKTGIKKVHLGLSGGIDSAVVACLAVDALGPNAVKVFALPTQYNQAISFDLAKTLADRLKLNLKTLSIQDIFNLTKTTIDTNFEISQFGVVHENLQSRIRGLLLMAYANSENSLLLTTGNKSEYATGYTTLYGDMCGGLAVIGDLTKRQVYQLAEYFNKDYELIPKEIITRSPSAELRPNQKDQDSLPEYEILDIAVEKIIEKQKSANSSVDKWLIKALMATEFKRWQAPPVLKVSAHSFGRGRRYPVAHKAKE